MKVRSTSVLLLALVLSTRLLGQTAPGSDKRLSWELGSALGLAGVLHAESSDTALVGRQFARASAAATGLGIKLPALPAKKGNKIEDSATVLHYLLGVTGNPIGAMLQRNLGPEQAAVFEIALKSNILLMLYSPGGSESRTIADVIRKRQVTARLPEAMTRQLLSLVDSGAAYDQVKTELFSLHKFAPPFIEVTQYSDNGERFYSEKNYGASAAELTKALVFDPDGPEHYFARGRAYIQLGKNAEAIADYSRVIQLQKSSSTVAKNLPLVYHNRGLAYSLIAKNALALDDLSMAIKLRPEYASAYKVRGLLYRKMGNAALAAADLATAERLQPGITK